MVEAGHIKKTEVDYSDFPVNGSQEEQERWFKAKVMERWHFAKLSGPEGEEYKEAERARSLDYYYSKHGGREQTQTQSGNDTGVKGVQYLDEPDDKKCQSQAKSQQRYIKYIKYVKFYVGHMFTIFFWFDIIFRFYMISFCFSSGARGNNRGRGGGNSNKGGRGRGGRADMG